MGFLKRLFGGLTDVERPSAGLAQPLPALISPGQAAKPGTLKRGNAARLFGYDIFISFALGPPLRGTHSYASDLARCLRERDFTVFFSEDEAPPGEQLDGALRAALYRSKTLVVIANRGTLEAPRWVRKEVEEFRTRHPARPVIPISVGGALQDPMLAESAQGWLSFQDKIWLDEAQDNIEHGIASEALVDRLAMAPTRFKSNVSWRWIVRAVIASLALLAIGLGVATKMANDSAHRARAELKRTVSLRLVAEAHAMLRGARSDGDERAMLQLVAARRIAPEVEVDASLLGGLLHPRALRKLIQSDAPVTAVAFSPDGSRIASADRAHHYVGITIGTGNRVRLWDGNTGQPIGAALEGHTWSAEAIAFSADGSRIVSGSADGTLRVWDANSRQLIGAPLQGHKGSVNSVAFSRDGSRIVSGGYDPSLRLWDARTGQPIDASIGNAGGEVYSAAFSPDRTRIVSGGRDGTLRLWGAQTGNPIGEQLEGHLGIVHSVAFSSDGITIASGSSDSTLRLWDAKTGRPIGDPFRGHQDSVNSVAFNAEGNLVVSGGEDTTIRVWHAKPGKSISTLIQGQAGRVSSVAFSPDSSRVVSGGSDGTLRLWSGTTGQQIGAPIEGHANLVSRVAFSPDGNRIVSGSTDGTVRLWDADSGNAIGAPLKGHTIALGSRDLRPEARPGLAGSQGAPLPCGSA